MSRPNRRLSREVRKLLKQGRLYRGETLHVRAMESRLADTLISVRKRFGGAVVRNRARRRVKALCAEFLSEEASDYLLLISIGDRSREAGFRAFREDLRTAFQSFGLLKS